MKPSFGKIIFFLTLLCSFAFAGGIEEDSGPEEISEQQALEMATGDTNLTTREDIIEYQDLSEVKDPNCYVTYGTDKFVNNPSSTSSENFATWC